MQDTVTAPAAWASALVNGDESGLRDSGDPNDIAAYEAFLAYLRDNGLVVVDIARDDNGNGEEPRFTWHGTLYHSYYPGCDVIDYAVLPARRD